MCLRTVKESEFSESRRREQLVADTTAQPAGGETPNDVITGGGGTADTQPKWFYAGNAS